METVNTMNDDIQMVYEDLLSMGLSLQNVEKCGLLVLEKLPKVKLVDCQK